MDSLWQDVRLAVRSYGRQPGFTGIALLILALGVGANTAIYTLVEAVALRSLPVTRPTELYRLGDTNNCCVRSGLQEDFSLFSYALYQHFRDETPEFSDLAAFQASPVLFSVRRSGGAVAARSLVGEFVSGNYFGTLGVPVAAGRGLEDGDDRAAAAPVAVLSYRAWRDLYGLDPAIVGATLVVGGHPVTVVGVASPAFFGETLRANPPDFWLPLGSEPTIQVVGQGIATATGRATSLLARADQQWLYVIGRLRPGVRASAAEGRVSSTLRSWLAAQPDLSSDDRARLPQQHVVITGAGTGISTLRSRYADALRVLAMVSALVLLAACANLANLFLARAQPFQFAMRAALGASRRRLARRGRRSGRRRGRLRGHARHRRDGLSGRGVRASGCRALRNDSRLRHARVALFGRRLHCRARLAHVEGSSDGRPAWRRTVGGRPVGRAEARIGRPASGDLPRAARGCQPPHGQPAASREPELRVSGGRARGRQDRSAVGGLHRGAVAQPLRSARRRFVQGPLRREREPFAIWPDGGQQLVGPDQPRDALVGRRASRFRVLAPRRSWLLRHHRHARPSRARHRRARHGLVAPRRRGQPHVC